MQAHADGVMNADVAMDVIIVGAGVAGLTAGYILQRLGLKVLVLEASERVGGRIMPFEAGEPWARTLLHRCFAS